MPLGPVVTGGTRRASTGLKEMYGGSASGRWGAKGVGCCPNGYGETLYSVMT